VIDFISLLQRISDKYGLKLASVDFTDVTLLARLEIGPHIYISIYRNEKKGKLNMALIVGNERIYGIDSEGGIYHEHPAWDPDAHLPLDKEVHLEEFILRSLRLIEERGLL